jgi:cyclopropane fatty-acyl-phospholipid synthase-like methyltransferase
MKKKKNLWDEGRWANQEEIHFDYMTCNIFEKIKKRIKIKNKNFIELGSGLGRLSYLCAKKSAKKVTLVDNSEKAIALSKKFFLKKKIINFKLIKQNILNLKKIDKYDVVFSSGVIEHFKKKNRFLIIKKHIDLCKSDCLIIHPSDNLYNKLFNNFPPAVKLYGFQKSFSKSEIEEYLHRLTGIKKIEHEQFHFFYTVPFFHNIKWLNNFIDKFKILKYFSGLTITHVKLQ